MTGRVFASTSTCPPTCQEDFSGTTTNLSWVVPALPSNAASPNFACLTASTTTGGSGIPGCNLATPDTLGQGALELTPSSNYQHGEIVSDFTFPTNKGLQITFTSYTYGGDSGGTSNDGADGISFFLLDGGSAVPFSVGATGGSLGYSCSNGNADADGLQGAYLGLGIDEYGNFLNPGDNTNTGPGVQAQRIALRGAGNVNWAWLSSTAPYKTYYNTSNFSTLAQQEAAVQVVCSTGKAVATTTTITQTPINLPSPPTQCTGGTSGGGGRHGNRHGDGDGSCITAYTYSWLNQQYPQYYPASLSSSEQTVAVTDATNTGQVYDFSSGSEPSGPVMTTKSNSSASSVSVPDYAALLNTSGGYADAVLPSGSLIANESAANRSQATPISYRLLITPAGYLTLSYKYGTSATATYLPVITNQSITTANPLPTSGLFRFGFSGSTGGSRNVHEITCFQAQPIQSQSSAGSNALESGKVQTGTQVFLSSYSSNNWPGYLTATPVVSGGSGLSISTTSTWDASCVLTGGGCYAMGTDTSGNPLNSITAEAPASRALLTSNGSGTGIALEWPSDSSGCQGGGSSTITSAEQSILNSTDNLGQQRLDWLRGCRINEQSTSPPGALRMRTSVLGDIIDSSPVWVGPPGMSYLSPFNDAIYGGSGAPENATGATAYSTYSSTNATRTNVVYAGSNDGLLHGFQAGNFNTNGSFNTANNNGNELIGFMPTTVLNNSNVVNLTSPLYGHNYFVDAVPGTGDLFYGGTWHTWLAGGLGAGGNEIYALDITNPANFLENNASTLVKGDWTTANLTCTPACSNNLGQTFGTPLIRRLHNGKWAIIFGNGLNSASGHAGIYIGLIDSSSASTGAISSFLWLDTGVGSTSNQDGINFVTSADLDGDHVTDYLYAGDLLGNVWRFDLTSSNTADWHVSKFGNSTASPLFTTVSGQPITTQLDVASSTVGGAQRVIVMFGTGQKIPATDLSADTYSTGTQSIYGIWDWNMNKWDNGTTTSNSVVIPASGVPYASLTGTQTISSGSTGNLLKQTLTDTAAAAGTTSSDGTPVDGYGTLSNNTVCWQGSSTCPTAGSNTQYGWYLDLPNTNEQVTYNPVIVAGALLVNTTIPPSNIPSCGAPPITGWSLALDVASGGGYPNGFFQATGVFTSGSSISAIQLNGVGSVSTLFNGNTPYVYFPTSSGKVTLQQINPQSSVLIKRVNWEELL